MSGVWKGKLSDHRMIQPSSTQFSDDNNLAAISPSMLYNRDTNRLYYHFVVVYENHVMLRILCWNQGVGFGLFFVEPLPYLSPPIRYEIPSRIGGRDFGIGSTNNLNLSLAIKTGGRSAFLSKEAEMEYLSQSKAS